MTQGKAPEWAIEQAASINLVLPYMHVQQEIALAISQAYERGQESQWQPIETAPEDGRKIQVWAPGYEWPEVIYYEHYPADVAEDAGEPGYWRYADDLFADVANVEIGEMTHWQDLPAPPAIRSLPIEQEGGE